MAILRVLTDEDPVLRKKALPLAKVTKNTHKLIKDMFDTMYDADGVGLAAPQVGVSQRVIVVDMEDNPMSLINPKIVSEEGSSVDKEGCLSVPQVVGYVDRCHKICVEYLDKKGKPKRLTAEDMLARILQHEIDHLDGILFTDKATSIAKVEDEVK